MYEEERPLCLYIATDSKQCTTCNSTAQSPVVGPVPGMSPALAMVHTASVQAVKIQV